MKKDIFITFLTKLITGIISLAVLILTARVLGAEARGEISLIVVAITIIVIINAIVGGPALAWLVPRSNIGQLLALCYTWAIAVCLFLPFLLSAFDLFPEKYLFTIALISLLECFYSIHLVIMLGKEKIKAYSIFKFLQSFILVSSLCIYFFIVEEKTVNAFIYSSMIGFGIPMIISITYIYSDLKLLQFKNTLTTIKTILKNGFYAQAANLAHLLSNRSTYYLLTFFFAGAAGISAVGIYSSGISLSEATLLISGSASLVLYSRTINTSQEEKPYLLTLQLSRFCLFATLGLLFILFIIPISAYVFIFGSEFSEVKKVIFSIAPGIACLSFSMLYSHYFSGTGRYYISTIGSVISLVVTLVSGYFLIPEYALIGAGISASLGYFAGAVFLFIFFSQENNVKINDLFPGRKDYEVLRNLIIPARHSGPDTE